MHETIASHLSAYGSAGQSDPKPPHWTAVVALLLALPWLNPLTAGPAASALPLLVSWTCTALAVWWLTLPSTHLRGVDVVRALALAWSAAALLNALIGLHQYAGVSAYLGGWMNVTGPGDAYGNLRQRNQFATLMAIGLASLLWWASRPTETARLRGLLLGAALLGVGNAASSSRTGLLQWAALLALTWYWQRRSDRWQRRRVWAMLASAAVAYGVAMWALPWLIGHDPVSGNAMGRLRAGDTLCGSRVTLWRNVLHLISLKPWTGWGWGELDYAHFMTLYAGPRFCDILDNAHNLPLHLAVELGLPLALLTCGAVAVVLWRARPWRETEPNRQLAWAVLLVIGMHSMLEYPLWYGTFQTAALASVCVLCWPMPWLLRLRRLGPGVAVALLVGCACAAWNYRIVSQIYLPPEQRAVAYRQDTLTRSQGAWLYTDQLRFAELLMTDVTPDTAARQRALALALLHFSPEARVVMTLLEADRVLGRTDEMAFYAARFKAAFPDDYARWRASSP